MLRAFIVTAALSLGTAAFAEPEMRHAEIPEDIRVLPRGLALQLGGGVTTLTAKTARDLVDTGGYWDVRAVWGTRSFLGGELAYVGAARGLPAEALLIDNGIDANVRAALPIKRRHGRVSPFVFGGVGWSQQEVGASGRDQRWHATVARSTWSLPVGAGLQLAHERMVVDLRLTYRRMSAGREMAFGPAATTPPLHSRSVGVTVGYEL